MPIQVKSTPTSEPTQLKNLIYDNRVIKKVQVKETPTSTPITVFQFHIVGGQYFVANWKSNMTKSEIDSWFTEFANTINIATNKHVIICPPACYTDYCASKIQEHNLSDMVEVGSRLICGVANSGAYTGQISASQAFDSGCRYYLAGTLEQRNYFGYKYDPSVENQMNYADQAGIINLVFISEDDTEAQEAALDPQYVGLPPTSYTNAQINDILKARISLLKAKFGDAILNSIIIYDPAYVGTGITKTAAEINELFVGVPSTYEGGKFLYGGPTNGSTVEAISTFYRGLNDFQGLVLSGPSRNATTFATVINQA